MSPQKFALPFRDELCVLNKDTSSRLMIRRVWQKIVFSGCKGARPEPVFETMKSLTVFATLMVAASGLVDTTHADDKPAINQHENLPTTKSVEETLGGTNDGDASGHSSDHVGCVQAERTFILRALGQPRPGGDRITMEAIAFADGRSHSRRKRPGRVTRGR